MRRNSETTDAACYFVDTARIYAGGKTEHIVGGALLAMGDTDYVYVGTKAHPSQPGGLSKAGITSQLQTSLVAMNLESVQEYYLHQPDPETSLLESLQCLHELVQCGTIQEIGMSNYAAVEMQRAFEICDEHNLTKPKVYQGLYNPLNRKVEEELLPVLRKHGCSFVAYNPLAAGLLTGRHVQTNSDDEVPQGRFKNNPNYLPRFYTSGNFQAVEVIRQACDKAEISMVEATYKWLLFHSALDANKGDGLLIGASSLEQLNANLKACSSDEDAQLPLNVREAFDNAWEVVSNVEPSEVFPYWRSYSNDMPNRDNLDHGASYNANKVAATKICEK